MISLRRSRIAFFLAASVTTLFGCAKDPAGTTVKPTRDIEIHLGASVEELTGDVSWPQSDGQWTTDFYIPNEHRLIVYLDPNHTLESPSHLTRIKQEDTRLIIVNVLPIRGVVTFDEALAYVDQLRVDIGVDPQSLFASTIEKWKAEDFKPFMGSNSTACHIGTNARVFVEIILHPDRSGWYVAIEISVADLTDSY